MTIIKLPLETIVKLEGLFHSDKFKNPDAFAYLGKNLEQWLKTLLAELGVNGSPVVAGAGSKSAPRIHTSAVLDGDVYVAEGALVEPGAYIQGPCFVGPGAEIRHCAYVRGNVYVGAKAVVGHTSEVKGSVLLDEAKAAHFAYVGDSILGRHVNLGAGTKLANLKLKGDEVRFRHPITGVPVASGLRKFGALMGDHAQTGCNSVLSPGTIMMPGATIMPCEHGHGVIKAK
jgi:NDP-sugar pyrophosphorylase family protein